MCLALPARVVELQAGDSAVVDLGGVRKTVSVALTPEAQVGDYVIVHVGHAIGLLDAEEAETHAGPVRRDGRAQTRERAA